MSPNPPVARPTYTSKQDCRAGCLDCLWQMRNAAALGTAARHHDRTKHSVKVTVTRDVYYGRRPGEPKP